MARHHQPAWNRLGVYAKEVSHALDSICVHQVYLCSGLAGSFLIFPPVILGCLEICVFVIVPAEAYIMYVDGWLT
jgi:hypothetical protein